MTLKNPNHLNYLILFYFFIFTSVQILANDIDTSQYGYFYRFNAQNSAFPNDNRKDGHIYKNEHFDREEHYNDRSVIIFIPKYFVQTDSVDLVFYFHGWWNNIDSSLTRFKLAEQFYQSNKNAILVLPETAKNAPDSYAGKLEEKNTFAKITSEISYELEKIFKEKVNINKISLAGHSGAYRVIAFILLHGGVTKNIDAVYIFDGLYSDIEKYSYWISNYSGKFINIYTPDGGTKLESENLMLCLDGWGIDHKFIIDDDFGVRNLKEARIITIKSNLGHSEVINTKQQFRKFLESSL